jgi:hypothetical protein
MPSFTSGKYKIKFTMGYEVRLIIGAKKSDYFLQIATVELAKIGDGLLSKFIQFAKGKSESLDFSEFKFLNDVRGNHLGVSTDIAELFDLGMDYEFVSIYEGKEELTEDLYGDPLPAIPALQILAAINEELKIESSYRRFRLAKKILEEFTSSDWDGFDVCVVPFGY